MIAIILILGLIGAVCVLIWGQIKYGIFSSSIGEDPYLPEPAQPPAARHLEAKVSLPSKDLYYQFDCTFKVAFTATLTGMEGHEPPIPEVESLIFNAVKGHSDKLALPQKDQLRHELNGVLMSERAMPRHHFRITAECNKIDVDPKQLAAIRNSYEEDLADERLQRKVSYLGAVFEQPLNATMWWLAQNADKVDDLEDKAKLLYRLDRRLHPDANPSKHAFLHELDLFLDKATDDERGAIAHALAGVFRSYGHNDLVAEAESLIPGRAMPSRNGSKPDNPDASIPAQTARS